MVNYVRLSRFAELTGITPMAVHQKRKAGVFIDGIHTVLGSDNKVYISLKAYERWVESGDSATLEMIQEKKNSKER